MCSCAYDYITVEADADIYSQQCVCTKFTSLVLSNIDVKCNNVVDKQWSDSVIQEVSEWLTDKLDWFYGEKDFLAFVWFYTERIPSRIGYIKNVQFYDDFYDLKVKVKCHCTSMLML